MKSIQPLQDLVVRGVLVTADSDPIMMENEAADTLITQKLGEQSDDLDKLKKDELIALATSESVSFDPVARKADIAAAVRAHRVQQPA